MPPLSVTKNRQYNQRNWIELILSNYSSAAERHNLGASQKSTGMSDVQVWGGGPFDNTRSCVTLGALILKVADDLEDEIRHL